MNLKTQVTILEALDTQAAQLEQTIAELDANLPTRLLLKYKQFFMNLGKRIHSQGLFWETIDPDVDKVELKILASDTYGECELETIIEQLLFNQGIIYILEVVASAYAPTSIFMAFEKCANFDINGVISQLQTIGFTIEHIDRIS
ncbi:hypothetical protein [Pseudoalteromonas galatheae]|uniref:hypothetical protein n=1 Tax=Pseudoalteromonas galatheae TaxID=579562 RepID=UPI0030CFBCB3